MPVPTTLLGLDLNLALILGAGLAIAIDVLVISRWRPSIDHREAAESVALGLAWAGARLVAGKALMFAVWLWVYSNLSLFTIDLTDPRAWIAYWLIGDLLYYATHRAEHRIRALWCSHLVHHNSKHMNLATAVRQPWTEGFYKPVIAMWAPLVGFHPSIYVFFGVISLAVGQWQHLEWFPKLPVFDRIFMTPSNHRVHHGSNHVYIDKNFGGSLVIWDHLFGTYVVEDEQPVYGVLHAPRINRVTDHLWGGYPELIADMRSTDRPLAIALGRP